MRNASAFVLASDWETLGFVLVEAARVGAAIVSTDVEFGPNEIIEPERSGLLVPPRDPEALAAAILRVLREDGLAGRLRDGARERSARFAPDEAVRQYTTLLQEVAVR
jgi:glycosyltransferase involved in cell wall biosynthesis